MGVVVELKIGEIRAKRRPSSNIFIARGKTGRGDYFKALLGLMGEHGLPFYKSARRGRVQGPEGLIAVDDVIIVKVNSQWDERGGTNTDLVKAIVEAVLEHHDGFAGEVVVTDNGQAQYGAHGHGGSLDYERNNAEDTGQSIQDVVDALSDAHKVSTYLWDRITTRAVGEYSEGDTEDGYIVEEVESPLTGIRVSYPKFTTEHGTHISFKKGVWNQKSRVYNSEGLKVLNVPVLKSHSIYGVTGCVKHYMGVASDKLTGRSAHRSVGRGGMGTQIAGTRMPTLNILDAIWVNANPGTGPRSTYEEATRLNVVMAGLDPVALDYWASKHVLIQAARLRGHEDLSRIDPDNIEVGSFGDWLGLSMRELRKAGHEVTKDEDRMSVYTVNV